jgi:hypothetical protein
MYLYLLKLKRYDGFKIGIANDIFTRIKQLNKKEIDVNESYFVESENEKSIKNLERQLLSDYENFKSNLNELSLFTSGNTEIRLSACFDFVISDIEYKISKFPHLQLSVVKKLKELIPKSIKIPTTNDFFCKPKSGKICKLGLGNIKRWFEKYNINAGCYELIKCNDQLSYIKIRINMYSDEMYDDIKSWNCSGIELRNYRMVSSIYCKRIDNGFIEFTLPMIYCPDKLREIILSTVSYYNFDHKKLN